MRRYAPALGVEMAAYRNSGGGAIVAIEELADRSGFLTISDKPSVTEWSYDAQIISRQHAVPLVLHGFDMRMPAQITAYWISHDGKEVLAAYIDRSVRRLSAAMLVRPPHRAPTEPSWRVGFGGEFGAHPRLHGRRRNRWAGRRARGPAAVVSR